MMLHCPISGRKQGNVTHTYVDPNNMTVLRYIQFDFRVVSYSSPWWVFLQVRKMNKFYVSFCLCLFSSKGIITVVLYFIRSVEFLQTMFIYLLHWKLRSRLRVSLVHGELCLLRCFENKDGLPFLELHHSNRITCHFISVHNLFLNQKRYKSFNDLSIYMSSNLVAESDSCCCGERSWFFFSVVFDSQRNPIMLYKWLTGHIMKNI